MSRLDRHIAVVRTRMGITVFCDALAKAITLAAAVVLIAIVVDRLLGYHVPHENIALAALGAAVFGVALVIAILRKPSLQRAAILIDERLGLKEKYSTAIVMRASSDEFARAAVQDAETTADNVSLAKRFPIAFPRSGYSAIATICVALVMAFFLPKMDVFGHEAAVQKQIVESQQKEEAKKVVQKALATIYQAPKAINDNDDVKLAKRNLEELASNPINDPAKARRDAMKAMQDLDQAIKQQVKANKQFAAQTNDAKMFNGSNPSTDEKGPVADASRALTKGDFSEAMKDLEKMAQNADKMSEAEKKNAAQQMRKIAAQLNQMANDPKMQQQMQQQLQQMGASKQQAQQIAKMMQQAAAGDRQAQQQLQQMAQQMQQNMSPQQKQQMQQAMKQMQQMANAQSQAQQMQQATQQMQQAMQQMSQAQQQQQQGSKQGANQLQQQQAGNQQQQQAQQQMQQAMQQMQAMRADMQQQQASQQAAQQAAADAAAGLNGQQGQAGQQGGGQQQGGNKGQWANAQQNQGQQGKGQGQGGQMFNNGGQGSGDRSAKTVAPYGVKEEFDPTQDDQKGKILASSFVKAGTIKGESKEQLKQVTAQIEKQSTEEVDSERVSRQNQEVVKKYFSSVSGQ